MRAPHSHRRRGFIRLAVALILVAAAVWAGYIVRDKRLALSDLQTCLSAPKPIGIRGGDALERLGIGPDEVQPPDPSAAVRFIGITKYLNGSKAVVTHTADDSSPKVPDTIAALDRYDIKATFFISTRRGPVEELWPLLAKAANNGHEIGSHARTHPCQFPPSRSFCTLAYSDDELRGSRDDILAHVGQPHVWSFAYPCGLCSEYPFVRDKLAHAGYLVARIYPDEENGGHLLPDMNTWDTNRYQATYTQAVQNKGGIAPDGRTDVAEINAKFDEVYQSGGIYNFLTHPNWLDFEEDAFYQRHLQYIARRDDIWYVPMGPLYAYQTATEHTKVHPLGQGRFAVVHDLDTGVFPNSVTLEFEISADVAQVKATDRIIAASLAGPTYGWDREFYRVAGNRLFVTLQPNTVLDIR